MLGKRAPRRVAYPGCWDVIGGRVETGETIDDALHREFAEEIGIVPVAYERSCSLVDKGAQDRKAIYHMHLVRAWTGNGPVMRGDEHTALAWFSVEEASALPELAMPEYAEVFRRIEA